MIDYFEKYKDVPKLDVIRAETGTVLENIGALTRAESQYVSEEIETFCRNKAIEEAILAGPDLLRTGDYSKILDTLKTAISVGLQKDLGLDYFLDPEERLRKTLESSPRISTGLPELDDLLGGGVARQELILFTANSGGGKSMNMLNLAKNFLTQGLNGVYISLEMADYVVSKRLDSMITKIGQDHLLKEMQKVTHLIEQAGSKMGQFIIKRMPENRTTIHHIRSYLQQLEQSKGFRPDFIVVDYIDIMGTTLNVSLDNLFIKDKYVTEEVRSLGFDFDCIMVSASQLGRAALEAEKLHQGHIQGGISKINTSDYTIGIKQDDMMRAAGEIYYEILKSRNSNGVGRRVLFRWDPVSLTVSSLNKGPALQINKKPKVLGSVGANFTKSNNDDGVLGLINI